MSDTPERTPINNSTAAKRMRSEDHWRAVTTAEEDRFIALIREHGATAVLLEDGSTTAWAGMGIRQIWYERREQVGNALLSKGRLRLGEPKPGSNAVHIEAVE